MPLMVIKSLNGSFLLPVDMFFFLYSILSHFIHYIYSIEYMYILLYIAENLRWVVGSGTVVKAIDEAVQYMKEGAVFQVIVPAELGYPASGDNNHDLVGPKYVGEEYLLNLGTLGIRKEYSFYSE